MRTRRLGTAERKPLTDEQRAKFERYLAEILATLGLNLDTPGTRETPRRMLKWLADLTGGLDGDPRLVTTFPRECDVPAHKYDQIFEGPIAVSGVCEHHVLPMEGVVYIGIVGATGSHPKILGISKFERIARWAARRFTVQERINCEIADTVTELVQPDGVAVVSRMTHGCTRLRGVKAREADTVMETWQGIYQTHPELMANFKAVIAMKEHRSLLPV